MLYNVVRCAVNILHFTFYIDTTLYIHDIHDILYNIVQYIMQHICAALVDNNAKFLYYSIFFPVDIISVCCLSGYDRSQFVSCLSSVN